ncbi:MAG: heat-inducible transcriptional repressor HrcA [Bacteroidia bacterium]|nr:heat-inducible transcriptional repressor HrcA [Bacteroidia bacterium]MDW8301242.1 heat-inducible transcriptional repressor HrcA [Bacteroidia bacterium]
MLNERKKRILSNIIHYYIQTCTPVSSQVIAQKVPLSPASIRNEMAQLQSIGLIYVPHTSSGRVPTTEGYQFYVQEIMPCDYALSEVEMQLIRQSIQNILQDFSQIKTFLTVLAKLTNLVSFGVKPFSINPTLLKIDFVKITEHSIRLILTLDTTVKSRIIKVDEAIPDEKLNQISQFFNQHFGGLEIQKIRYHIQQLERYIEKEEYALIEMLLLNNLYQIQENDEIEIVYEGLDKVITQPEFKSAQYLHELIQTLEAEEQIKQVLHSSNTNLSISVGINPRTEEKFSMIQATYYLKKNIKGYIGFIGPQRMDYPKLYAIANYTLKELNANTL